MSFVGMSFFGNHIIAFADTKSTTILPDGSMTQDVKRGIVHKLRATDDYVLAMHGTNVVAYMDNGAIVEEPIENVVAKIEAGQNPRDLVCDFMSYLRKTRAAGTRNPYCMMFGRKTASGLACENFSIWPTEFTSTVRFEANGNVEFAGDAGYCDFYNFSRANLATDDVGAICEELEKTIRFRDSIRSVYNSVGLPVDVIKWVPKN